MKKVGLSKQFSVYYEFLPPGLFTFRNEFHIFIKTVATANLFSVTLKEVKKKCFSNSERLLQVWERTYPCLTNESLKLTTRGSIVIDALVWEMFTFKYLHFEFRFKYQIHNGQEDRRAEARMLHLMCALLPIWLLSNLNDSTIIVFTYKKLELDLVTESTTLFGSACLDHLTVIF